MYCGQYDYDVSRFFILTPKPGRHRVRDCVLWVGLLCPLGLLKYVSAIDSGMRPWLEIANNIISLLWLKYISCENIWWCVLADLCALGNGLSGSFLWVITWNSYGYSYDNEMTAIYLSQLPFIILTSILLILIVRRLRLGRWPLSREACALGALISGYMIFLSNILLGYVWHYDIAWTITHSIPFLLFLVEDIVVIWISWRKNVQQEKLKRLSRLSYERGREQKNYEETCRRVEQMAKLRHDFYEQLSTAKYILSVDVSEGMELLSEMERKIEQVKR